MFDATEFGAEIARTRKALGMNQADLAAAAGVSIPYLSNIENGHRNPSIEVALAISCHLGVTLDYLVRGWRSDELSREIARLRASLSTWQKLAFRLSESE